MKMLMLFGILMFTASASANEYINAFTQKNNREIQSLVQEEPIDPRWSYSESLDKYTKQKNLKNNNSFNKQNFNDYDFNNYGR